MPMKKSRQNLVAVVSLILLVQVAMPWHMLHMQAMAGQAAADQVEIPDGHPGENISHVHSGSHCHPPALADPEAEVGTIAGFCEWLCAQGQTAPLLDDLIAPAAQPQRLLRLVLMGAEQIPDAVPTPPPIA